MFALKIAMPNENLDGHNIVFIVGCARSGTTWLQRLLATYPKVRTGQESFVFSSYIGPQVRSWHNEIRSLSSGRGGSGIGAYLQESEFFSILREEMRGMLAPMIGDLPEDYLFVEKTPNHALWISEIVEMLPKARFINMLRDGRDVVSSLLAASKSWWSWADNNAFSASRTWVRNVEAARKAMRELPRSQFYEVRYEQLLESPLPVLEEVSRFLGLKWDQGDILKAIEKNDAKVSRKTATAIPIKGRFAQIGSREVQQPNGFIRRAKSGSWKQDLSPVDKILAWVGASRTMAKVGYPWIMPWF